MEEADRPLDSGLIINRGPCGFVAWQSDRSLSELGISHIKHQTSESVEPAGPTNANAVFVDLFIERIFRARPAILQ